MKGVMISMNDSAGDAVDVAIRIGLPLDDMMRTPSLD